MLIVLIVNIDFEDFVFHFDQPTLLFEYLESALAFGFFLGNRNLELSSLLYFDSIGHTQELTYLGRYSEYQ